MVMREEEQRQTWGLVQLKCQTLNKNKVAERAAITNSLISCQTNPAQESRAGETRGRVGQGDGLEGTERDKSISWQATLHLKVSTAAGALAPCSSPHLSAGCVCTPSVPSCL
ncbi:hypothetical protein PBY51_010787 [Eleginops maclovinus]|uniref:Uncharacterized protein n=1 Tax=Eleginops maclovinus TaxID=56733 RepID=A0AAN8AF18_ELEMC|nr:hypothetical protein PBY51_010787 [Eleginops maclovinus]